MATGQLEKVKEFLTCTICTDTYSDPCTLLCQHTFCRKCVTEYTKTRPEALQSKFIPCPCCRQVTKVPDPTKPVDEWAKQLKPSIIIQGLIDTSQPGQTTTESSRCCNVCEHLGETTPATSWCPECEMALCDRCTKTHQISPASRDHEVCNLSAEVKVRRKRKVLCREHKKNCIEFHCKDCKKSACQTCCIIYHRTCKAVVTIDSMKHEMTADLNKKKNMMSKMLGEKSANVQRKKTSINEVSQKKIKTQSQIRSVSQRAVDKIKQNEKELMIKLDQVTEKQMSQLQADVKTEEIDIQMYRQHCEFIDQAVNSESVMDMYDMYQACESGALLLGETTGIKIEKRHEIADIQFSPEPNMVQKYLGDLQLGKIDVTYQDSSRPSSSQVYPNRIDVRTSEDKETPSLRDITMLGVNGWTIIVTDWKNRSVKSFYTRNGQLCHSVLPLDWSPWSITQLTENQVMVSLPWSNEIVTIRVTSVLQLLSTIKTKKGYLGIAVLNASSFAAGSSLFGACVDILDMSGRVMRSISTHNNMTLFECPRYMCVNNKGSLLVSDKDKHSVTCLTPVGDVLWQYIPSGYMALNTPWGITTDYKGDILLADNGTDKVIQLTENGEFVKEVLTAKHDITKPLGIFCHKPGGLMVCEYTCIKEFNFT